MFGQCIVANVNAVSVSLGYMLFIFFKQKTAYEMRISDWSSDVCSSDLEHVGRAAAGSRRDRVHQRLVVDPDRLAGARQQRLRLQIGRAPCREGVCQYV